MLGEIVEGFQRSADWALRIWTWDVDPTGQLLSTTWAADEEGGRREFNLAQFGRKAIEHLLNIYRKSIENL